MKTVSAQTMAERLNQASQMMEEDDNFFFIANDAVNLLWRSQTENTGLVVSESLCSKDYFTPAETAEYLLKLLMRKERLNKEVITIAGPYRDFPPAPNEKRINSLAENAILNLQHLALRIFADVNASVRVHALGLALEDSLYFGPALSMQMSRPAEVLQVRCRITTHWLGEPVERGYAAFEQTYTVDAGSHDRYCVDTVETLATSINNYLNRCLVGAATNG